MFQKMLQGGSGGGSKYNNGTFEYSGQEVTVDVGFKPKYIMIQSLYKNDWCVISFIDTENNINIHSSSANAEASKKYSGWDQKPPITINDKGFVFNVAGTPSFGTNHWYAIG